MIVSVSQKEIVDLITQRYGRLLPRGPARLGWVFETTVQNGERTIHLVRVDLEPLGDFTARGGVLDTTPDPTL